MPYRAGGSSTKAAGDPAMLRTIHTAPGAVSPPPDDVSPVLSKLISPHFTPCPAAQSVPLCRLSDDKTRQRRRNGERMNYLRTANITYTPSPGQPEGNHTEITSNCEPSTPALHLMLCWLDWLLWLGGRSGSQASDQCVPQPNVPRHLRLNKWHLKQLPSVGHVSGNDGSFSR